MWETWTRKEICKLRYDNTSLTPECKRDEVDLVFSTASKNSKVFLDNSNNTNWKYDSCCSSHMTGDFNLLYDIQKITPRNIGTTFKGTPEKCSLMGKTRIKEWKSYNFN